MVTMGGLYQVRRLQGLHNFIIIFIISDAVEGQGDGLHADGRKGSLDGYSAGSSPGDRWKKKRVNQLEKHRNLFKILMNDYKLTFFFLIWGWAVTMALTCSCFLLDDVVPVWIIHLAAAVNITPDDKQTQLSVHNLLSQLFGIHSNWTTFVPLNISKAPALIHSSLVHLMEVE